MQNYYTIEVEVTNICNAKCVFCANSVLKRPRGFLDVENFRYFVQNQKELLKNNIFQKIGTKKYPRITFCGLGEPLLHPKIEEIIKIAHDNGFYTQLITNGALLSKEKAQQLVNSHLDEMAISLHSTNPTNYLKITGLDLEKTLKAIDCSIGILKKKIKVSFWRIKHPNKQFQDNPEDQEIYQKTLKKWKISQTSVLGPSEPWSRDGFVPNSKCKKVKDKFFWCNKIYFTFNLDWKGNVILCCNDYNRETVKLGNAFSYSFNYSELFKLKEKILQKESVPNICKNCRRWEDNEIFSILDDEDIDKITFKKNLNI